MADTVSTSTCPFCEEGEGVRVLSRRIVRVGGAGMTGTPGAPSEPRPAQPARSAQTPLVAVPGWPHMVCGQCESTWVTLEQYGQARGLIARAAMSPESSWQVCWDNTAAELAVLQARFVEIHDLPKEQFAAAEPELKAMRKQAIALGAERYALVDARRRLPPQAMAEVCAAADPVPG